MLYEDAFKAFDERTMKNIWINKDELERVLQSMRKLAENAIYSLKNVKLMIHARKVNKGFFGCAQYMHPNVFFW